MRFGKACSGIRALIGVDASLSSCLATHAHTHIQSSICPPQCSLSPSLLSLSSCLVRAHTHKHTHVQTKPTYRPPQREGQPGVEADKVVSRLLTGLHPVVVHPAPPVIAAIVTYVLLKGEGIFA